MTDRAASRAESAYARILGSLSPDERAIVEKILQEQEDWDYSELLEHIFSFDYDEIPVSMEEFLLDPYYLGATGASLYPMVLEDLIEVFEGGPYTEIIATGGVGWGKSIFQQFALIRMIYECWCFKNPQSAFGLMPGSVISFVNLSTKEEQAKKVVFRGVQSKISRSPFFMEKCRPDPKIVSELRFPKQIWLAPGTTTENSALGLDVFGAAMDEVNFMPVHSKSVLARGGEFDMAETLYTSLVGRIKSRYMRKGRVPGKIILGSSATYPDTFLERRISAAKTDPSIYVMTHPTWGVKPEGTYSGKKFQVLVGSLASPSKILTGDAPESAFGHVIEVPEEFRPEFESNLDHAIRTYAGVATLTIEPYFREFHKVMLAIDERPHPYSHEEVEIGTGDFLLDELTVIDRLGKRVPKYNPDAFRWIHLDSSLTRDSTGVAMTHISGTMEVERRNEDDRWVKEEAPCFMTDLMLRINPPKDGEISFAGVRQIIYRLMEMGFKIGGVSSDLRLLSAESLQVLRDRGINAIYLSVEKEDAYRMVKEAFYEKRMRIYKYPPVLEELRRLEYDKKKGKVDHPLGFRKDVADALCGSVVGLTRYLSYTGPRSFEVTVL